VKLIEKVELRNFRNYGFARIELHKGINSLVGRNGLGKTNFLEAVHLVCEEKALRAVRPEELVKWGEEEGEVKGFFRDGNQTFHRRILLRKKEVVVRRDASARSPRVVALLPDNISFVKGGPEERRREMDSAISRLKAGYARDLHDYARVVRHRNELLRGIRAGSESRETLAHWNSLLISLGRRIVEDRKSLLKEVKEIMGRILEELGRGDLEIRYYSSIRQANEGDVEGFLKRMEAAEIRRGQTLVGPHRDEVIFLLEGRSVRRECSQGEQKLVMLAWKLSIEEMMRSRGMKVILLLDDCLSELDDVHAEKVLQVLEGREQVIITDAVRRQQLFKYRVVDLEKSLY